jgi:hypothetical protein
MFLSIKLIPSYSDVCGGWGFCLFSLWKQTALLISTHLFVLIVLQYTSLVVTRNAEIYLGSKTPRKKVIGLIPAHII